MEIRLIGTFEAVEAVTRELRRQFMVVSEKDKPARSGGIRRYLTLNEAVVEERKPDPIPGAFMAAQGLFATEETGRGEQ
ncbi:MAG: hypothetical protein KJ077_08530 [Anaerolineae bacterium]|nr:hypothetical protein [Anaerolineae bacterium]